MGKKYIKKIQEGESYCSSRIGYKDVYRDGEGGRPNYFLSVGWCLDDKHLKITHNHKFCREFIKAIHSLTNIGMSEKEVYEVLLPVLVKHFNQDEKVVEYKK